MKIAQVFLGSLMLMTCLPTCYAIDSNDLTIELTEPALNAIGQYKKYEVSFTLSRSYKNNFDPEEINVEAIFEAPSGIEIRIPGFYFQDISRQRVEDSFVASKELLYPKGIKFWKARFTPTEEGNYKAKIIAKDKTSSCKLDLPGFKVIPTKEKGFIHCTAQKPGRFQFENGEMFFPIGLNNYFFRKPFNPIGGSDNDSWLSFYEENLSELNKYGMNYIRFFNNSLGSNRIEQKFGEFDLAQSHGMDIFFDLIGYHDIYVMMDIEVHTDFRIGEPVGIWESNPYNIQNGGPCQTPAEFFTNSAAKKVFKDKLRYIAARWGYSPNLFAIELWSEVETITDYNSKNVVEWHKEMLDYWHSIDPYKHLLCTSLMETQGDPDLMALPSLDFTITEKYGVRDIAEGIYDDARMTLQKFNRPTLNVEFGMMPEIYGGEEYTSIIVHNGLWSSALSGAAGCPSYWYWDRMRKEKLLHIFKPISKYVENENFKNLHPVKIKDIRYQIPQNELYPHLALREDVNNNMNKATTIKIPNTLIDNNIPPVPRALLAKNAKDGTYNPLTLDVNFPADGQLVIWGWWLSDNGTAKIRINIDGKETAMFEYPAGDWAYRWKNYKTVCIPKSVKIAKGRHIVVMDNIGDASLSIKLNLCNYIKSDFPNVRVYGIGDDTSAYLWMQNRDNIWYNAWVGLKTRNVKNTFVEIADMQPGTYIVEWWDTYQGMISRTEQITVGDAKILPLSLPEIEKDLACKINLKK